MTCPYVHNQMSQPMQWRAGMYTIRCSINSLPSPQVVFFFSNSVCFKTEYLCEQLHKFDMALWTGLNLPNHQYHVRVDGSGRITLQNPWFLRKLEIPTISFPFPSAVPETSTPNPTPHSPITPVPQTMDTEITSSHSTLNTAQPSTSMRTKKPPGIVQITSTQPARFEGTYPSPKTTTHVRWGEGDVE